MNSPVRVIGFVNAAHFIDHYSMLIFAAAVIVMGPALGMAYSELLPYATPGFVAFGAGSLLTGWLGDRWSRRHMMVIFFVGIGPSSRRPPRLKEHHRFAPRRAQRRPETREHR